MKKIRNGIMAVVAGGAGIASLGSVTSCSKPMYSNVIHIAPYLHEITYDDYREDTKYETIDEAEAFGCSSARNGNFYGRNFDYIYNDTPEFIVHVKANEKKKRHASLAVATHFGLREDKTLRGSYHKQLELIPNLTMDGINDHGVICSANVVSLEPKKGKEEDFIPETNPDNPNAKNVHMLFLVRFVLDNADSVSDAITKLSSDDINIMGNLNEKNFLHIMIADKNSTAIVEFYRKAGSNHNHFDVVPRVISDEEKPIMTNFYKNIEAIPGDFTNDEKSGYERHKILENYYDLSNNFLGMQALLKKVQFSQAYEYGHNPVFIDNESTDTKVHGDLNSEWYSEKWSFDTLSKAKLTYQGWLDYIESIKLNELKEGYRKARKNEDRKTANPAYWHTTHNSTYEWDWTNNRGHLQVIVQEEYAKQYDFYQDIIPE